MNEPGNPAMYVYGRLAALGLCLQAYGFTVEHVAGGLVVRNPSAPRRRFDQPVVGDTIRCLPRRTTAAGTGSSRPGGSRSPRRNGLPTPGP